MKLQYTSLQIPIIWAPFGDTHLPGSINCASGFDRIKVDAEVEHRRRWSFGEELKAVEESPLPGMVLPIWRKNRAVLQAENLGTN